MKNDTKGFVDRYASAVSLRDRFNATPVSDLILAHRSAVTRFGVPMVNLSLSASLLRLIMQCDEPKRLWTFASGEDEAKYEMGSYTLAVILQNRFAGGVPRPIAVNVIIESAEPWLPGCAVWTPYDCHPILANERVEVAFKV